MQPSIGLRSSLVLLALAACTSAPPLEGTRGGPTDDPDDDDRGSLADGSPSGEPAEVVADVALGVDEEDEAVHVITPKGVRRFDVDALPPGARFDAATGRFSFRPDFTQSGTYVTAVTAYGAGRPATTRITTTVRDSIMAPKPTVVSETFGAGFRRLVVRQATDAFLDPPGKAGRSFDAVIVVPSAATEATPLPVVIGLHGFDAGPWANASSTTAFRIEPDDPDNTYWWGYGDWIPGPVSPTGKVQPYTIRRVLNLLDWVLRTYPEADRDRVFATGASMGGAGALLLGLEHARHFAGIEATIAQTVARNHRPSRVKQLTGWWGTPEANLGGGWDEQDVTRIFRDSPEARDQYVFTKHGKDDGTIHFGAVVTPSPLTKESFYDVVESQHVGHLSIWDEGAHGPADPVLGDGWWDAGWNRITDVSCYLTRKAPFPAFTRSSANDAPLAGAPGNGKRGFNVESGYAGNVAVAGDTGWSGAIAGALNRFLRWDTRGIVDTHDKLSLPLLAVTGAGDPAPKVGYPTKRDRYDGPMPIVADVTPRRTSAFRPAPGETVRYRFGERTGTAVADADGAVTVPALPIGTMATVLELERDRP